MKLQFLLFPIIGVLLCGCGEGNSKSNLTENKTLGKFPSVFVELPKELEQILDDMRAETQTQSKGGDPMKIRDKYVALEDEAKQRAKETATAELDKIIERTVPFEVAYDNPDFEIRSAMIDGGDAESGALTITVAVGAKKDITASMGSRINYQIVGTGGNVLFGGAINPFVSNQIITSRTFPNGLKVSAGDVCSDQGSWLMLYCGSYDFTDFGKIVFIQ